MSRIVDEIKIKHFDGMKVDQSKIRVSILVWIPFLLLAAFLFSADVFQIQYYPEPSLTPVKDFTLNRNHLVGFAINTPGCRIPEMDAFDKNIQKFIKTPDPIVCNKGIPPLFESNMTSLYLLNSSLIFYNVSDASELKCCYKAFWRNEPENGETDDKIIYSDVCYNMNETNIIHEEFIKVICTFDNATIYQDMFSFVPIKNISRNRIDNPRPVNVLVVGVDAVSRLNLHRQMPKTVNYLKNIEAVELLGYNKVGDNTFPNLIPVLTGMFEGELRNACWPNAKDYFDNCSFIWKDYKDKGYVTAYGEDSSWMGLFNYQRRGFRKQTTDYAYNYFNRRSEKEIGNSHSMNVEECEGGRLVCRDLLDYIRKFVITMGNNDLPYFGFFWGSSLSHDYLNKPKLGDEDYFQFFNDLKEGGHLNNTALIFMSDHGIRWGDIRQTYQGRMEERLPFVIVALPQWYKSKYPKAFYNLKTNARRLTAPFDLHKTLLDLRNNHYSKDLYLDSENMTRGISFLKEISPKRTCEDAGIVSHWCTCQQSKELDKNATEVHDAASFAVEYINLELTGYAQCANLSIDSILNARLMTHGGEIKGDNNIQDYMITLRTLPGEGIFEVTVRHTEKDQKYGVMGTISRLNLYGKQSSCITDFHLKLYCYCTNLLF